MCSGASKKTSPRTHKILKHEVLSDIAIAAASRTNELLQKVAMLTILQWLQKVVSQPSRRVAKKPMVTEVMKKKRLDFRKKYQDGTSNNWKKVIFTGESSVRVAGGS